MFDEFEQGDDRSENTKPNGRIAVMNQKPSLSKPVLIWRDSRQRSVMTSRLEKPTGVVAG